MIPHIWPICGFRPFAETKCAKEDISRDVELELNGPCILEPNSVEKGEVDKLDSGLFSSQIDRMSPTIMAVLSAKSKNLQLVYFSVSIF